MSKLFYVFITITIILLFNGCSQKVEVPVYIYNKPPILTNFNTESNYDFGKLYNKDNNVCIVKWNTCIPKKDFIDLVNYIQLMKTDLSKHQEQIIIYNNWSKEQNER